MRRSDVPEREDEARPLKEGARDGTRKAPQPIEERAAEPLSGARRFGYAVLGAVLAAMGFWIFPYQLERGDLLKTLLGAGLAVIGAVTMVRAIRGRRLRSLGKLIDVLSDLG